MCDGQISHMPLGGGSRLSLPECPAPHSDARSVCKDKITDDRLESISHLQWGGGNYRGSQSSIKGDLVVITASPFLIWWKAKYLIGAPTDEQLLCIVMHHFGVGEGGSRALCLHGDLKIMRQTWELHQKAVAKKCKMNSKNSLPLHSPQPLTSAPT